MSRNPIYKKHIQSREWRDLRLKKLQVDSLCEVCYEAGKYTMAQEVHHLVPVESSSTEAGMKRLMYSYQNLQSLCHACHTEIHRALFSHSKASVQAGRQRDTERFIDKFLKE